MISITFPISCDFSPRKSVFRAMSPTRSLIWAIASTPSRPSVVPACATSTDFDAASFTDSAFCAIWRDVRDSSSIVAVTSATDVACCDALAAWSWITVMKSEENEPMLAPVSWIWARTMRRFLAMALKSLASARISSYPSSGTFTRSSPPEISRVISFRWVRPAIIRNVNGRALKIATLNIANPTRPMRIRSFLSTGSTSL